MSWPSLGAVVEGNGGALAARLAEVWAPADAARMAELDRLIAAGKGGYRDNTHLCPCGCLAPLGECAERERKRSSSSEVARPATQTASPSSPSSPSPAPSALVDPERPAAPAKETPMAAHPPCPKCKSSGRHKSGCPRLAEILAERRKAPKSTPGAKPAVEATQKPSAAPSPRRSSRRQATFGLLDEWEELEQRGRGRLAEIALEVKGFLEQIQELKEEAQQLRRRLGMDEAKESVRAAG